MSAAARILRPFLFTSVCRRTLLGDASRTQPGRQRLLYTTRPLRATIVTSATASTARHGAPPASSVCELLRIPTQEDIDDAELDAEVLPLEEARIQLTERAAEQLRRISARESDPDVALRISVESGGCHGYQYKMNLTSEREPDDYLFSHPTLKPSNVIVDAVSLPLLKNSTLDYATELIGSSFRISDNPQAKGSGCGCGVSWELKI